MLIYPRDGEEVAHGVGGRRKCNLRGQARPRLVRPEHVRQVQRVCRWGDVREVQLPYLIYAVYNRPELSAHLLHLVVREPQPGQVGDLTHLFFGYHVSPPAFLTSYYAFGPILA